jgi:4-hydroxy-2-oxoheptanedioate aldolase
MGRRVNTTKQKLRSGSAVIGVFLSIPSPRAVELCGIAGFDYVIIDAEHGPMSPETCEDMIRAAELSGITPIIRVTSHDPKGILRFLDVGALGIMAPQVNTAADARAIVDAVKYAPVGRRGLGPGRAAAYGLREPMSAYAAAENEQTMIIAQLESIAAVDELDQIVRTPGIDAFEIGTGDLSASMGFPGESSRVEVQAVVKKFVDTVLAAGSVIGDTANDRDDARQLYAAGYRMLDCGFESVATGALSALVTSVRAGAA